MALNESLAQTIATTVSTKIVDSTTLSGNNVSLKPDEKATIAGNWKKIVEIIVEEVFTQIKQNAVVELDTATLDPSNSSLASPSGPVTGAISVGNKLKGKVT
jgi:hypothetical protein